MASGRAAGRLALAAIGLVASVLGGVDCHRDDRSASPKSALSATALGPAALTRYADHATIAVFGDFGADTAGEAAVAKLVKSWAPDFIVTTGDNNYPNGDAATIDDNIGKYYASFIGNYHGRFGPGANENRFWPSPGNHDWRAFGLAPYLAYFTLPGNERYYDVDLGLVHLYAVDSDPNEPDGVTADSVQGKWLEQRLHASTSCHDVVFFHHAAFSSGEHGSSANMQWPFEEWGAEAVLSGHDHTYERVSHGKIPYVVTGLGGASLYEFHQPVAGSLVRYDATYGALRVELSRTGAHYEFWNVEGQKIDAFDAPKRCD